MPHWYGVLLLHFGFMLHPEPSDHCLIGSLDEPADSDFQPRRLTREAALYVKDSHSNTTRYTDGPTVRTIAPPAMNSCPGAVSSRSVDWPVLAAQE